MSDTRRKICVVTSTRADYGLLHWVMRGIESSPHLRLQVVVTGSHLSTQHGMTYREIESDGFTISARVDMLLAIDTPVAVAKSMGLGVIGFADALEGLRPDVLLVLGDRFEILAVAQTALLLRIPVAHIGGGDATEGAFDESIRHAITKLSHLHFVTHARAAERVRQLGENPELVFDVGSPGIDYIRRSTLLDRIELCTRQGVPLADRNVLITYHPETLSRLPVSEQMDEVVAALEDLPGDFALFVTRPNADPDAAAINAAIDALATRRDRVHIYSSLGQTRYLSLLREVDFVVGNSSSALTEAPTFGTPAVDIGDRQKGRPRAESVIHAECRKDAIRDAMKIALARGRVPVKNPFGDGYASERIVEILESVTRPAELLQKKFFVVPAEAYV